MTLEEEKEYQSKIQDLKDHLKKVKLSFWIVLIMSVVLLSIIAVQQKQQRDLSIQNKLRISENTVLVNKLVGLQEAINSGLKESDARQVETLRKILCFGEKQVQTSKQRTPEEKAQATEFYNNLLDLILAKHCDPPPNTE